MLPLEKDSTIIMIDIYGRNKENICLNFLLKINCIGRDKISIFPNLFPFQTNPTLILFLKSQPLSNLSSKKLAIIT